MKTEINCPVLNSEKFSKEIITDIVNSLEQLENTKNTIFNRLNKAFSERVNKLCNIKSRINRANQIIASYATIKDAITLKSRYHYPTQKHNYYIPTIIDQNSTIINKGPTLRLNKIVLNDKSKIGTKSIAPKEKIVIYDKYLTFATQFNDIVNELDKVTYQEATIRKSLEEFQPILSHVTNDFTFGNKMKIEYAKKQQYNPAQEINQRGNSLALQDYLIEQKEEEKKNRKKIQEAPKSIVHKRKIKKRAKGNKLLSKTNSSKINFDLPTNIDLGGIAELGGGDDEDEDYKEENKEEEEEEEDDDFKEDNEIQNDQQFENQEEETNMPIDYIRHNNQSKFEANKTTPIPQAKISNYQKPLYNANTNNNTNIVQNPPQQTNTFPNNPQPPQQVVQPPQPKAPNPPPSIPSTSKVQVIVGNSGAVPPPPPPPPPPPVVPTIPTKTNESIKAQNPNTGPEISLEDELAKAMKGLKKTVNVEVKQKPKELTLAEQLALSRNKLKKVSAPPPKKEVKKSTMDILSEQIKLRFQNLRRHEEENEDEDSEKSDEE